MSRLDPILEPIMASPKLEQYIELLQHTFSKEREARLQFYNDISEDDKAEFINGEAVFHSPVKMRDSYASGYLYRLLADWTDYKDLGVVFYEKAMIELTRNSYEPDIVFFDSVKAASFDSDQMLYPPPNFVVEVLSPSTEKIDRGIKLEDYAAHGIEEYWIIDPDQEFIEQYVLLDDVYDLRHKLTDGNIAAVAVSGFTFPVRAVFDKEIFKKAKQTLLSQSE
ncbi:MAG: Uma2 family endonuclease [Chloroflexota bacterium]